MPKEYNPTKRAWFKVWVDPWLDGSTRDELTHEERAWWIDVLALATRSRFPGVIATGRARRGYVGYPLERLAGMLNIEPETLGTFLGKCVKLGKIKCSVRCPSTGRKLSVGAISGVHKASTTAPLDVHLTCVIHVIKWATYQSDYLRQRELREGKSSTKVTGKVTGNVALEGEREREREREGENFLVSLYNELHGVNKPDTARRYICGALANGISVDKVEAGLRRLPHKRQIFKILDEVAITKKDPKPWD